MTILEPRPDPTAPAEPVDHPERAARPAGGDRSAGLGRVGNSPIAVRQAGKRFGSEWVIRGLDFAVEPGTIFGLFGPSGSGKTTTLRLLLGLLRPDEGDVEVLGVAPNRFDARTRARIGYLPQLFVLYPELSVWENLDLVASLYGLGWWKRRRPMRRVLELVELWDERRKAANQLSGGMQRRLELAAALVHNPELVVVDEPTAGIDPILRVKFWDQFRSLRDEGRTVIVTSQYVTEAEYCDQIAMLGHGRLVACGTPADVRRQAMGGELVDIVADGLDRRLVDKLEKLGGVRASQVVSFEEVRLTVDRAGEAIPRVLATLTAEGIDVRQIQEHRPNFDEVFVRLMERER